MESFSGGINEMANGVPIKRIIKTIFLIEISYRFTDSHDDYEKCPKKRQENEENHDEITS